MKHKNGFNPLSRNSSHRRAMHRNMVTSLFRYERVTTTKQKALEVRRTAEKLITRAKVDTVHNRRQAARFIQDPIILAKLFTEIGPRMKERNGGYTRVLKLGFRQGDAADVAILELVDFDVTAKTEKPAKAEKKTEKKAEEKKPEAKKPAKKAAAKKTTAAKAKAPAVEETADKE